MVNERYDDKYEGHEEGEYHFSDDQANYEMEGDVPSGKDGTVVAPMPAESLADKLKNHRRIVIGIVVFIVLLSIVYKLVMPSSTAPVTDFSQQATSAAGTAAPKAAPKATPSQAAPTAQQPQQPAVAQQAPPPAMTTTTTTQVAQQPAMPSQAAQPAAIPQQPMMAPANPMVTTDTASLSNKSALDRIATLEQQNSAMMNLLQTQYTQRIADTEAQNTQLRTQVQELTSRVSSMEVAFRQLTKILRNMHGPASASANSDMDSAAASTTPGMMSAPQPVRVSQPKSTYTVQAIIPGRAWLKSEAGDTVTVAEGDMLKDFGRITKIDPYDGIVDIDTGNKVITLSYGASGD